MENSTIRDHYDVAIIGAGPVGSGLAIDLAQRGRSVCLIEKYTNSQQIPKGQNLTQRSGEHLRRWGVSSAIREATLIPPEYGNQGITAYGSWLSGWHYDWFKRASVREFYFADNERLPQYETERVLRARAASFDTVDIITGCSYLSHTEQNHSVKVEVSGITGDSNGQDNSKEIKADWLIGCDGARSPVRQHAGIQQNVEARDRRMALVTFRSAELNKLLTDQFPGRTIFNAIHPDLEGYWQFLGRTDPYDRFFFHAPVPDDASVDTFDFSALLQRAAGTQVKAELEHVGFWDLRFTHATDYRKGRVFIAGDAAHSHPPYGGYGVNVGFEDTRNLAWKLNAVVEGWGNDALLDSYTTERHPVFASTRDDFIARMIKSDADFTTRFNPQTDAAAFESQWTHRAKGGQAEVQLYVPNYGGSPLVFGEAGTSSGAVGDHSHIARAGYHLSPRSVTNGEDLFNLLGSGFTLIALDTATSTINAFAAAAESLNVPLTVVTGMQNDNNAAWQANVILVRPDEYIAWAGNAADADPVDILRRAIAL